MSNRFSNDDDFDSKLTSRIHDLMNMNIIETISNFYPKRMYLFGGMIRDLISGTKPKGYDVMVMSSQDKIQELIKVLVENYEYTEEYSKRLGGNHIVRFPGLTIIFVNLDQTNLGQMNPDQTNRDQKLLIDFPVNSLAVQLGQRDKFTISDVCDIRKCELSDCYQSPKDVDKIIAQIRHKELIHNFDDWEGEEVLELYRICEMFTKGYTSKQAEFGKRMMYLCDCFKTASKCRQFIDVEEYLHFKFITSNLEAVISHYARDMVKTLL